MPIDLTLAYLSINSPLSATLDLHYSGLQNPASQRPVRTPNLDLESSNSGERKLLMKEPF